MEDRISDLGDKINIKGKSGKNKENEWKVQMEYAKTSGAPIKDQNYPSWA
jgi:hypothetical protein